MLLEIRTTYWDWNGGWIKLDISPVCFKDAPWYEPIYFEISYITVPENKMLV